MNSHVLRPSAYVIAPTNHGTMIVNRFDYRETEQGSYGVGHQLLNTQTFDSQEVNAVLELLSLRRQFFGDGVMALDLGANIGVHTIEWAKHMFGWGHIISVEAQQRIYYALAGNIAINNCFNAQAIWAAVGKAEGRIKFPEPNYFLPSSFGSFEITQRKEAENIGQKIDWSEENLSIVDLITIDGLKLDRIDLIKLDVEGMEEVALEGAFNSIRKCEPIIVLEHIKSDKKKIVSRMTSLGYRVFDFGLNFLLIHDNDPTLAQINGAEVSLSNL